MNEKIYRLDSIRAVDQDGNTLPYKFRSKKGFVTWKNYISQIQRLTHNIKNKFGKETLIEKRYTEKPLIK